MELNKGIVSLVEMWKELPRNFILHIYGTGSLENILLDRIKTFDNIKFFGFKDQKIIFDDYKNSISAIIPSELYEPFGMGIPECFSLSVPVIATNIGNPGMMVSESKGGEVFSINDVKSLMTAITRIITNREIYSQNAYKYYCENLSEEKNYNNLIHIYNKLCN